MTHNFHRSVVAFLVLPFAATLAPAQIKEPPRAEKVDVQIRYRIRADRDERLRQYRLLEKHLASIGFVDARKDDPDRDLEGLDPTAERFVGTLPGNKVLEALNDPRVQSILFGPSSFAYPDAPEKPVAVRIGIRSGLPIQVQQLLHTQIVAHLGRLGFSEGLAYDTRGYTLVRGVIPYKSLDLLVKDARYEPGGWFAAATPLDRLPAPLRDGNPLRWTEVLPITEFAAPFAPTPVLPGQFKFSPDLRAILLDPVTKDAPLRVEAIFETRIGEAEALRSRLIGHYSGASLDGIIGNVASIRFPRASSVESFALEPGLLGLRLPRQGTETITIVAAGKGVSPPEAIRAARLEELHKLGYTGAPTSMVAGVKVVLIGSDFSGAEKLIGTELPRNTKIVDLTTELTPELLPAKADPARLGTGTAAARALAAASPGAELILVRIDPGCFFHLYTVIRLARGEIASTEALQVRLAELATRSTALDRERSAAISTYKAAFLDLSDNEVAVALRKKAKADLDAVFVKEKDLLVMINRYNAYQKEITTALRGANVIVNTLVWESGYPLDALNEFAGTLETLSSTIQPRVVKGITAPKVPLVWVQAASNSGASVWGGQYLDANRDGFMEYVPQGTKPPADNWSQQLNFLGTRTVAGDVTPDLAKDTKLRIVVQWREPASLQYPEGDTPTYALTLRLLRQLDPAGAKRSSDDLEEVARSASVPNVIYRTPTFLVFEQMLEFTVPAAGRYALLMESVAGPEALLPALRRDMQINPRIAIETVGTAAGDPKAVFRSFLNFTAGVGTPGDSYGAITVGTDTPYSQTGGGTGILLRCKSDVLGPDAFSFGPQSNGGQGMATAFAGGAAAVLFQARAAGPNVFFSAGIQQGKKVEIPATWLKYVPRAKP